MTRLPLLLLLAGCFPALERPSALQDGDGDGIVGAEDCDDADDSVFPGGEERCNDADDDCDGRVDEDLPAVWYLDEDGDGVGSSTTFTGCDAPPNYVQVTGDCNDADDSITEAELWYPDDDGDGYGDESSAVSTCAPPAGWIADGGDCDDTDAAVNPEGTEVCDENDIDEDCDGAADDEDDDTTGQVTWFTDGDGDGYGSGQVASETSCDGGPGLSAVDTDCDDSDPLLHPDTVWFSDGDGDDYGGAQTGVVGCQGTGVLVGGDCDDGDASVNPGQRELCATSADDDCDGLANELDPEGAQGLVTRYDDLDADGYGDDDTLGSYCSIPPLTAENGGDCDDADPTVNPGAAEVCDEQGIDEDCDGLANGADPGVSDSTDWYVDGDGDGYGAGTPISSCDVVAGRVTTDGDCDDADPAEHPDAVWCPDDDGDGFGSVEFAPTASCTRPGAGYVPNCLDCDDSVADTDPTATWFEDVDGDGFGDSATLVESCTAPGPSWVEQGGDCDDSDVDTFPGAAELCQDGVVNDCDGNGDDRCFPTGIRNVDTLDLRNYGPAGARAGTVVAGAPDLDGDGVREVLIGAPGVASVYRVGDIGGTRPLASNPATYQSELAGAGSSLVVHGKITSSGSSVLRFTTGTPDESGALVYDAVATGTHSLDDGAFLDGGLNDEAGHAVATADLDGDNDLDVVVCAPGYRRALNLLGEPDGRIYAVPGPVTSDVGLLLGAEGYTFGAGDGACSALVGIPRAAGADVVAVGAPGAGEVHILGPKLIQGGSNPIVRTLSGGTGFGSSLAYGSLFGQLVLAVGEPNSGGGKVSIYLASDLSSTTLETVNPLTVLSATSAGLGASVALPGDLDGDGQGELVIGDPTAYGNNGAVYVLASGQLSDATAPAQALALTLVGPSGGAMYRAFAVGDVSGDGVNDLAIGVPQQSNLSGYVYYVLGSSVSVASP